MMSTLLTTSPYRMLPLLFLIGALMAGCGSSPKHTSSRASGGGYYMDDGPGDNIPAHIANLPDAVPRIEPHNNANFRPYTVLGQRFVPVSASTQLRQRGVASWYGRKFHGQKTANGETYDMYAMTAAHPTLPLPSYARVTHERSGRSIIVRVNDRGPFLRGRVIDLSYAAAAKLGIIGRGSDTVVVEAITHADIRKGLNMASSGRPPAAQAATATRAVAPPQVAAAQPAVATPPATVAATTPDALAALNMHTAAPGTETPPPVQQAVTHTPEPPRSPAPTVTANATEGIYLQFGAFGSYISADRLANQLNGEISGVEARNVHVHSGSDLHRVRLGPYPSRTAAVNAAVRIQEVTGMAPTLAYR